CTITGLVILASGAWQSSEANGVTLTTMAFTAEMGETGRYILMFCVLIFAVSTMIGYSYYGSKCTSYLFGSKAKKYYRIFYTLTLIAAAMVSIDMAVNFVDGMYAIMAIPTMTATILLSPRVMKEARRYFATLKS
ncbi:MAG: alanine:cation symporter family protein, partial [Candidatus Marinimicrobia bacterium]|nr:alanine:cation symporter family protein [Candidatus Neomarinimicrobiota bacterium]